MKELRVMILKMMKELGRRMDTQREKLEVCKEFKNIKNNQIEMKLVFFFQMKLFINLSVQELSNRKFYLHDYMYKINFVYYSNFTSLKVQSCVDNTSALAITHTQISSISFDSSRSKILSCNFTLP